MNTSDEKKEAVTITKLVNFATSPPTSSDCSKTYDLDSLASVFNSLVVNLTQSLYKSTEENRNLVQHLITCSDPRSNPSYIP